MNWLRRVFGRRRIHRDLSDEIRAHLDEKIEDLVASGMPREEAGHAARRAFGNVLLAEQDARVAWRWPVLESVLIDARCALRARGAFLFAEILLLAVGFAVALLALSETRYALDPALRVPHPNRTYFIGQGNDTPPDMPVSLLSSVESRTDLFSITGEFFDGFPTSVRLPSAPADMNLTVVSSGMLDFLPRDVDAGRPLVAADFNYSGWRAPVALATHSFLAKAGLSASEAVGHEFRTSNGDYQIVGVFPGTARFPAAGQPDLIVPMKTPAAAGVSAYSVLAELRLGLKSHQVTRELTNNLSARNAASAPVKLAPIEASLDKGEIRTAKDGLAVGTLALLLLVATSSLFELLDTTRRRKELTMKLVLGATPGRLLFERAGEILVVCAAGLAVGIYLLHEAWPTLSPIWTTEWTAVPRPGVFLLASVAGLLVVSCVIIAAGPSFVLKTVQPQSALKEGGSTVGRPAYRARMIVIALQIAVCVGFTLSAARLAAQLYTLATKPLGLQVRDVWNGKILLPRSGVPATSAQAQALLADLRARLDSIPGVSGAAFSSESPASGFHDVQTPELSPAGQPPTPSNSARFLDMTLVDPEYLQLLGSKLLEGRFFTTQDLLVLNPPMILSEPLARRLFGDINPAGKEVEFNGNPTDTSEVVGVVGGMRSSGLGRPLTTEAFAPIQGLGPLSVTIRTKRPGYVPLGDTRSVISQFLPGAKLTDFRSLASRYDSELEIPRRRLGLLAVFSLIASLVAVFGLASALFTSIKEKDLEIGIRRALGASNRDLARALLRSLLPWVALGICAGVALPALFPTPFGLNAGASSLALAGAEVASLPALALLILLSLWVPLRRAFRRPVSDLLRAE